MATLVSAAITSQVSPTISTTYGGNTFGGSPTTVFSGTFTTAQITKLYKAVAYSITTSHVFDLTSGLTDPFGAAIVMTNLKHVYIVNNHASIAITVGGGTTPVCGADLYTITAGGCLNLTSTYAITTNINLKIALTGTVTVDILLLGN
jgi:hypothetical protein